MLDSTNTAPGVDVVSYDHPFRSDYAHHNIPAGATVADLVARSAIPDNLLANVQVVISRGTNSTIVPISMWHQVRPKEGSHVLITPRVEAAALGAVLAAALPSVAGWAAGGLFAAGTLGYTLAYAAFTIVGALAIQALIPPPSTPSAQQDDPNYSITGTANVENPHGVYPTVLGRHHMYPPKTARGYTEAEGEDIYYRGRFTFGCGLVTLESLKIGNTPIWEFEGVQLEFLNVDKARTLANMPQLAPLVKTVRSQAERPQFAIYRDGFNPTIFDSTGDWGREFDMEAQSRIKKLFVTFSAQKKNVWTGNPEDRPTSAGWVSAGAYTLRILKREIGTSTWSTLATINRPNGWKYQFSTTNIDQSKRFEFRVEIVSGDVDRVTIIKTWMDYANDAHIGGWRMWSTQMSLYPDDIAEEGHSALLEKDVPVIRNTRERATSAGVDVSYQGIALIDGDGNSGQHSVTVGFAYREVGDTNWKNAGSETHTGATTSALRFTKVINFPHEGEYEIRVTRTSVESDANSVRDDAYLTAIRSTQAGDLPSHGGRQPDCRSGIAHQGQRTAEWPARHAQRDRAADGPRLERVKLERFPAYPTFGMGVL